MNTHYPKTLAVAVGIAAFVAFFTMFGSLSRAHAGDADDIALIGVGLIECYPELKRDRSYGDALGILTNMLDKYPEAEVRAAGQKAYALVRQDKARFCQAFSFDVHSFINK